MRAVLIPAEKTPLTLAEVLGAFWKAHARVRGVKPSDDCLCVLVAQSALETGNWQHMRCYNFGNVKAGQSYEGLYCQFRCNEVIDGVTQWFDPPHPQTNFRAHRSAEDGAAEHLAFLWARYPRAFARADAGDPIGYVRQLKAQGYFTAPIGPYSDAVVRLTAKASARLAELRAETPHHSGIDETLRRGMESASVFTLQHLLNRAGAEPLLKLDGSFGPKTEAAVVAFQRAHGHSPSGIVEPEIWRELRRDTEPAPPPSSRGAAE